MMQLSLAGSGVMSDYYPPESEGGFMSQVNHNALRAAQNKAVIARFLGRADMWLEANQQMKAAVNMPWYRREQ